MTNPFPFKVLFWFENDAKIVAEIKRTDIQSENKSLIYKWIVIQNEKQSENEDSIAVLTFRSMDQQEGMQIREFEEGTLTWNAEQVRFNSEEMQQIKPEHVSTEWFELITQFLDQNNDQAFPPPFSPS